MVFKFATVIVSNSKFNLKYFFPDSYQKDKRFNVINNAIDCDKFLGVDSDKLRIRRRLNIDPDKFIIGHVGRFNVAKNHRTIFKVAKECIKENDKIEFVLCGKGTESDNFKKDKHIFMKFIFFLEEFL